MNEKRIIIIRHAHRSKSRGAQIDNGLSTKGKQQSETLGAFWRWRALDQARFFSSPKKRCRETLQPLMTAQSSDLNVWDKLDEQQPKESSKDFRKRVETALRAAKKLPAETVVLCSHGDWVDEASELLCGERFGLKKGGWLEFKIGKKGPQFCMVSHELQGNV